MGVVPPYRYDYIVSHFNRKFNYLFAVFWQKVGPSAWADVKKKKDTPRWGVSFFGAGYGNRTRDRCLGSDCFAIKLILHKDWGYYSKSFPPLQGAFCREGMASPGEKLSSEARLKRNGGRTDIGFSLIDRTICQVAARIPHPTSLTLGHLPPGGRLWCGSGGSKPPPYFSSWVPK